MTFREYLHSKIIRICVMVMALLYMAFVLWIIGVDIRKVWVLLPIPIVIYLLGLYLEYLRVRKRLLMLREMVDNAKDAYLVGETIGRPTNVYEEQYFYLMKKISSSALEEIEKSKQERKYYADYIEKWVHEMKTPLTACSLILANGGDSEKLKIQLQRANSLIDSIMSYARLDSADRDFQVTDVDMVDLVHACIKEDMSLLIEAGISMEVEGEAIIRTDAKLFGTVLKQLFINEVKYCPGCHVKINIAEFCVTLEDNGIGIPLHELKRVTDRGFAGEKVRNSGLSTGMGLYIVSEICKQLEIDFSIESEEGKFSRFIFRF